MAKLKQSLQPHPTTALFLMLVSTIDQPSYLVHVKLHWWWGHYDSAFGDMGSPLMPTSKVFFGRSLRASSIAS
eukprot:621707-Amphidinium_carterae.1